MVGDLGNDVDDDKLRQFFICYPSFAKGKVVRDKKTGKSKGFGFASFLDPDDAVKVSMFLFLILQGDRLFVKKTVSILVVDQLK